MTKNSFPKRNAYFFVLNIWVTLPMLGVLQAAFYPTWYSIASLVLVTVAVVWLLGPSLRVRAGGIETRRPLLYLHRSLPMTEVAGFEVDVTFAQFLSWAKFGVVAVMVEGNRVPLPETGCRSLVTADQWHAALVDAFAQAGV